MGDLIDRLIGKKLYTKTDKEIILYPMTLYYLVGIVATGFVCDGTYLLVAFAGSFFVSEFNGLDVFGMVFIFIWTAISGIGAYLTLWSKLGYKVIIDADGIYETRLLFKNKNKSLRWAQIEEYGYYFDGNSNDNGNVYGTYMLYFSPTVLKAQNDHKKKPAKEMIGITFSEENIQRVTAAVFPFCRMHTDLEPETVEIKDYFM